MHTIGKASAVDKRRENTIYTRHFCYKMTERKRGRERERNINPISRKKNARIHVYRNKLAKKLQIQQGRGCCVRMRNEKSEREGRAREKTKLEGSESCVFKKNLQKNRYRTATCNIEFERKFEIPPCLSRERKREIYRNMEKGGKM